MNKLKQDSRDKGHQRRQKAKEAKKRQRAAEKGRKQQGKIVGVLRRGPKATRQYYLIPLWLEGFALLTQVTRARLGEIGRRKRA